MQSNTRATDFQRFREELGLGKLEESGENIFTSRGFVQDGDIVWRTIPEEFQHRDEWRDGQARYVWTWTIPGESGGMIVTYCEGDVIMQMVAGWKNYQAELKRQAKFYESLSGCCKGL